MLKYLVAFLASVAGAFTQRVSGFGFAIVAMMAIARLPFGTYGEAMDDERDITVSYMETSLQNIIGN